MDRKRRSIISILLSIVMVIGLLPVGPFASMEAKADTQPEVSYQFPVYNTEGDAASGIKEWKTGTIGGSGTGYSVVTGTSSAVTWNDGWYVVTGGTEETPITIPGVTVTGNVHLILADGCNLTVTGGTELAGIDVSGNDNSLTIYGQTAGTGHLNADGGYGSAGIGGSNYQSGNNITINGGIVTAKGGELGAGIGGGSHSPGSNITINGGKVTAIGGIDSEDTSKFGAGIGNGYNCSTAASAITVANDLVVRADNDKNPPATEIGKGRQSTDDLASALAGKRHATAKKLSTPTAADFTFEAPSALSYDGQAKSATVTSKKIGMGQVSVEYYSGTTKVASAKDAGDYTVKINVAMGEDYDVATGLTADSWKFTVTKRDVTLTSASVTKEYDGNPLTNSTVTPSGDGFAGEEGATYTVTGSQKEIGTSKNSFTYSLKQNTNKDNYTITTVEGDLTVTKKKSPAAPTGLVGFAPTTNDSNDGKVTGVNTTMEYKIGDATSWTACTGTEITGLSACKVYVRVKETADTYEGASAEVTVGAYVGFNVTYNNYYGNGTDKVVEVASGSNAKRPDPDPTYEGWNFKGWVNNLTEKVKWIFDGEEGADAFKITKDTTIYADWEVITEEATVSFDFESEQTKTKTVIVGTSIDLPIISKEGCTFKGWAIIKEDGEFNPQIVESPYEVTEDVLFHAMFAQVMKIDGKDVEVVTLSNEIIDESGTHTDEKEAKTAKELACSKSVAVSADILGALRTQTLTAYAGYLTGTDSMTFGLKISLNGLSGFETGSSDEKSVIYKVKPWVSIGNSELQAVFKEVENDELTGKRINFRLAVPSEITEKFAAVDHIDDSGEQVETLYLPIKTVVIDGKTEKYVEAAASQFSYFNLSFTNTLPTYEDDSEESSNWWKSTDAGWVIKPGTNDWYFIRNNALLRGWYQDSEDGRWYYLDPATGKMLAGWVQVNGKWYYLNPVQGAQTWVKGTDGKYHYDPNSKARPYGSMYCNETTPDGYKVDKDGAWIEK